MCTAKELHINALYYSNTSKEFPISALYQYMQKLNVVLQYNDEFWS